MAEICIHIGAHKTGSTAIQHALRDNRRWLRGRGFALAEAPPALLALMTGKEVDPELVRTGRAWLEPAIRAAGRGRTLLISWEAFSGNPHEAYANAGVVAESLRRITEGHRVRIVVYLRRQDEFVESMYTQRIQEGGSLSFPDYLAAAGGPPDWSALLRAFEERFGGEGLVVRRYHRAFLPEADSLVKDFGAALDLPPLPAAGRTAIRNPGYSREALEFARLVNPHLDEAGRKTVRTMLQEFCSREVFSPMGFFRDEERRALLDRCAEGNAEVARRWFPGVDGDLFPPPRPAGATRETTPEEREVAMARMLARMLVALREAAPPGSGSAWQRLKGGLARRLSRHPRLKGALIRMMERTGLR